MQYDYRWKCNFSKSVSVIASQKAFHDLLLKYVLSTDGDCTTDIDSMHRSFLTIGHCLLEFLYNYHSTFYHKDHSAQTCH